MGPKSRKKEVEFDKAKIDCSYNNNEFNAEDEIYLTEIFSNNEHEKDLEHHLLRQFYEVFRESHIETKNLDHILHKIHFEINTNTFLGKHRKYKRILDFSLKMAGIFLLAISVFWGTKNYYAKDRGQQTWIEIKSPVWTRIHFNLPDGSTGWLNSSSTLKYCGNFLDQRQLSLSGEAFFDVVKDRNRPFVVKTNEIEVKVLGTRFNIASYDNEHNVEVVLEEGSLILKNRINNNSISLNPNDLVLFNKQNNDFAAQIVDPQKYSAWTQGKLVFRNDPLDVVARRLARWYNLEVEIKGDINRNPRLRATFVDETLEEVMMLISRSLLVDYKIIDGNINQDNLFVKKKLIITVNSKRTN